VEAKGNNEHGERCELEGVMTFYFVGRRIRGGNWGEAQGKRAELQKKERF